MKFPFKTLLVLLVLGVLAGGAYFLLAPKIREWQKVHYRHEEVTRGDIITMVNATGKVEPVTTITVGTFVSGPLDDVFVDFNDGIVGEENESGGPVHLIAHGLGSLSLTGIGGPHASATHTLTAAHLAKSGSVKLATLLAKIDPQIYEAAVLQQQAQLDNRLAEQERVRFLMQQAERNNERAKKLRAKDKRYISDTEVDQYHFEYEALKAQFKLARASVAQARGALEKAQADLQYTDIYSPVDGVIINRKVSEGQTVAAGFQTPELFVIAPKLDKMHISATVDEADIGLVAKAKERKWPVKFTVDAHPEQLFTGTIYQIRMSATTTQNVVTYPVIIKTDNPEGKLMPEMTANLSFQVAERKNKIRIPNAALRFYPDRSQVRKEDLSILDGTDRIDEDEDSQPEMTAIEKAENRKNMRRRHVWVEDGDSGRLRAVEIFTGESNNSYTEMLEPGELREGDQLVTGVKKRKY